jgi:hypothetical protein
MSGWLSALFAAALILPGAAGTFAQPPKSAEAITQLALSNTEVAPRHIAHDVEPVSSEAVAKATPESKKIVVYNVADLLKKLKEEKAWPENTSDEQIKLALASLLQVCSPRIRAAVHQPSAAPHPPGLMTEPDFRWNGDQLVVSAYEAVHDSLVKEIELRRRHSFRQVTVEVRIMQGGSSLCTPSDDTEEVDGQADWKDRWILFQQEFANLESEPDLEEVVKATHGQVHVPSRQAATTSSDTSHPIVYQFATDQQMRSFINGIQNDDRTSIVLAPKVTLFDGQSALMSDTAQRPFVTDVQQIVGDRGVAYQPVIKVLWEGTKILLSPRITPDGHRLKCRIMFADIKDCMQFRPPRYPDAHDVWIQHPVAATSSFECSMDIPSGQTLLIGGLFPTERKYVARGQSMIGRLLGRSPKKIVRKEMTYIAITPRTVESE